MSEFNINKKIDNLGRIVIPKEIRRKLKIVEGENLELSILNNQIIVKKCSASAFDGKILEIVAKLLIENVEPTTIIFDLSGKCYARENEELKLDFLDEFINGKLKESTINNRYICPIYMDGSLYGGIVIDGEKLDNEKIKVLGIFKKFIERYLEA